MSTEALLLSVFDFLPVSVALVDRHSRALLANQAFIRLLGIDEQDLKSGLIVERFVLPLSGSSISLDHFSEGAVDVVSYSGERFPCFVTVVSIGIDGNNYFLLMCQELNREKSAAERNVYSRKMESLGALAGGIAHDLNNILTGILGHVSFLRLSLPPKDGHTDSLLAIEDGARRAAAMSQQILSFSRNEHVEHRPINLSLVVAAGVNLLRAALPKNVELVLNGNENDLFVDGDESRLTQLFMNLAVNARDALPQGGRIDVTLDSLTMNTAEVHGSVSLPPGQYVRLRIADNGMGMTPDIRSRIFEPFFTTKMSQGTGIGLATVHSIVKAHRGTIVVDSEIGCGTSFEVLFPASASIEHELCREEAASESLPGGTERVLVVDDEEVVRTVIQRSLEHLGYSVDVATDGADALSRFRHNNRGYNLVILDMMMPKMAGDEVFARLLEIDPEVRVLLVSGYSSEGRTQSVLKLGGMGFVQKPFAVEDLARAVRRCLDAERSNLAPNGAA